MMTSNVVAGKKSGWYVYLLLIFLMVFSGGSLSGLDKNELTRRFQTMAEEINGKIDASLAIWTIDIEDSLLSDLELTKDLVKGDLDLELSIGIETAGEKRYRYEKDLAKTIERETLMGALKPGELEVVKVKQFGDRQGVELLLAVDITDARVHYRILRTSDASLAFSGIIGVASTLSGEVLSAAEEALSVLKAGDTVMPVAYIDYDRNTNLLQDREQLAILGSRLVGKGKRIYDFSWFREGIYPRGRVDKREFEVNHQGFLVIPQDYQETLYRSGVRYILTVLSGSEGTSVRLVDLSDQMLKSLVLKEKGFTAQKADILLEDRMKLKQMGNALGLAALAETNYNAPSGPFSMLAEGRSGNRVARMLLDDYVQTLLLDAGVAVKDRLSALQEAALSGGSLYDQVRRDALSGAGIKTMVRLDVSGSNLALSMIDVKTLEVKHVGLNRVDSSATTLARWLIDSYTEAYKDKEPLMLGNIPAASNLFSRLQLAREISGTIPLVDPLLSQAILNTGSIQKYPFLWKEKDVSSIKKILGRSFRVCQVATGPLLGDNIDILQVYEPEKGEWTLYRTRESGSRSLRQCTEALQPLFTRLPASVLADTAYRKIGKGMDQNEYQMMLFYIASLLQKEKGWRFVQNNQRRAEASLLIALDDNSSGDNLEFFLRILDQDTQELRAIKGIGIDSASELYQPAERSSAATAFLPPVMEVVSGAGSAALLLHDSVIYRQGDMIANVIKERLLTEGIGVIDSLEPFKIAAFNEEHIVYELPADRYIVPFFYEHEENAYGIKSFNAAGFLAGAKLFGLPEVYSQLQTLEGFPELESFTTGELSLTLDYQYGIYQLKEEIVRDALLAGALKGGAEEVIDPEYEKQFFQSPDSAGYRCTAELLNNPLLGSFNPSLYLSVKEAQGQEYRFAADVPLPGNEYSLKPGGYQQTLLDHAVDNVAAQIVEDLRSNRISRFTIALDRNIFLIDGKAGENLKSAWKPLDVAEILRKKLSAALYRRADRNMSFSFLLNRDGSADLIIPEIQFREWVDEFDSTRISYETSYELIYILNQAGKRIGMDRINLDASSGLDIGIEHLQKARGLEALAIALSALEAAKNHVETKSVEKLKERLEVLDRNMAQVAQFGSQYRYIEDHYQIYQKEYEALVSTGELQGMMNKARILIGQSEFRDARRLLEDARKQYGEREDLDLLLTEAIDRPKGIVGRVRPGATSLSKADPVENYELNRFRLVGEFGPNSKTLYARVTIRPQGVYRIYSRDPVGITLENADPDHTRLVLEKPEYVVVLGTKPVELKIVNNSENDSQPFTIRVEQDNEALYRYWTNPGKLALTSPGEGDGDLSSRIVGRVDAAAYQRHQKLTSWGVGSTVVSLVSLALGGGALYVEQQDTFGFHSNYLDAVNRYDDATTSAGAASAAEEAEQYLFYKNLVRYTAWGGLALGGVSALSAVLFFLADKGYPDLERDGPLFSSSVSMNADGMQIAFSYRK